MSTVSKKIAGYDKAIAGIRAWADKKIAALEAKKASISNSKVESKSEPVAHGPMNCRELMVSVKQPVPLVRKMKKGFKREKEMLAVGTETRITFDGISRWKLKNEQIVITQIALKVVTKGQRDKRILVSVSNGDAASALRKLFATKYKQYDVATLLNFGFTESKKSIEESYKLVA